MNPPRECGWILQNLRGQPYGYLETCGRPLEAECLCDDPGCSWRSGLWCKEHAQASLARHFDDHDLQEIREANGTRTDPGSAGSSPPGLTLQKNNSPAEPGAERRS